MKVLTTAGGVMYVEDGREQSKTTLELAAENEGKIIERHEAKKA